MPWKTTKLRFCGFAVRRRSLHTLTLFFAIAAVPALSWAILVPDSTLPIAQKIVFILGALAMVLMAFQGWWTIFQNNTVLFREEARLIWPGAAVLLALVTWLGCRVAEHIKPDSFSSTAALGLGGAFMIFLLVRCCLIGRHPKRSDIVRGGSSRRRSRSTATPSEPASGDTAQFEDTVEVGDHEEDDLDGKSTESDSVSTDSTK